MVLLILEIIAGVFVSYGLVTNQLAAGSIAGEFGFLLSVLLYLRLYKHMSGGEIVSKLGLGRKSLSLKIIGIGLLVFLVIFIFEIAVSLTSAATNVAINPNTGILLAGEPLWFYLASIFLTPICEEVLFRAFMIPRIGIIISAVIFGLSHASYDSTFGIEMIAAFLFAMVAGYAFKKTRSLYPSIIAHILVNALAVVAFIF